VTDRADKVLWDN